MTSYTQAEELAAILDEALFEWGDRTGEDAPTNAFALEPTAVEDALLETIYADLVAISDMEGHPKEGGVEMRKYFVRRILHFIVRAINAGNAHPVGVNAQVWMEFPPAHIQTHRSLMVTSQATGKPIMDVDVREDMTGMADALGQCVLTTLIQAIQQRRGTVFALVSDLSHWWFVRYKKHEGIQRSTLKMRFNSQGYPVRDDLRAVVGAIRTVLENSIEAMQTQTNDSATH